MAKLSALVFLGMLVHPPLVDQNVSQALNVLKMKLATTKNVLIHVLVHAVSMQNVKLEIIVQSVLAHKAIQVIHSLDVKLKLFSTLHLLILVNHLHVDQMHNAKLLVVKLHVHVFPQ